MDQIADGHRRLLRGVLSPKSITVNLEPGACAIVVAFDAVAPENATGTGLLSVQGMVLFAVGLGGFEALQLR